jgi:hypothetical protein
VRFTLALVLGCAALAVCAAESDPVPRPEVKPGDSWSYRRMDYHTNQPDGLISDSVTFANERVIQTVGKRGRDDKEIDSTYTGEWNFVSTPNGAIFDPHQGLFKFPMRPGDTHESRYQTKFPLQGAYEVRHQRRVRVVGWEDVTVPAGKFRALRVESEGPFQRVDAAISGTSKETAWYAPEVKRYVKWTFENWTFKGRNQWWGLELLEYKVQ